MKKYLLSLTILLASCTSVFYQPNKFLYSNPKHLGINFENIYFNSKDGTKLHSWYLNANAKVANKGLVLFFHGNAQNLSSHYINLAWITSHGYDLMIFDYRGYGISEGSAEKDGIYEDTIAAINKAYVLSKENKSRKFIVYGQSLGGALAMKAYDDFKHKDKVSLLVLDSTFTNYKRVASDILKKSWLTYIFSPLAYVLISNKYSTTTAVPEIKTPVLVIHGKKDSVINFSHGKEIFNSLTSDSKHFWPIEKGHHIETFSRKNDSTRSRFLELLDNLNK